MRKPRATSMTSVPRTPSRWLAFWRLPRIGLEDHVADPLREVRDQLAARRVVHVLEREVGRGVLRIRVLGLLQRLEALVRGRIQDQGEERRDQQHHRACDQDRARAPAGGSGKRAGSRPPPPRPGTSRHTAAWRWRPGTRTRSARRPRACRASRTPPRRRRRRPRPCTSAAPCAAGWRRRCWRARSRGSRQRSEPPAVRRARRRPRRAA